jgi:hypothetical protein
MPVVHVVTFTFAADIIDEVTGSLGAALDEFAPHTNAVFYHHGADLGMRNGNAHYAVTAIFADRHTFQTYVASAQHQRIIADFVKPHLQSRSAVQFELAADRMIPALCESAPDV